MTHFVKSGDRFSIKTKEALNIQETLPTGTYTVGFDEQSGQYYLEKIESFKIEHKLYGATEATASRILKTFKDRPNSTGVLLSGEKGSGKTMLAKKVSILAAEKDNIPTIVINQPWCGESFNSFIQQIEQPAVVVFDEFEKVYGGTTTYGNSVKQEQLLTLLDGVYPSKKLYLLTCNNKQKLDANLQNRPGRIFYFLEYHGVDDKFIKEYCDENLEIKANIPLVCSTARVFQAFNFDMLKALVEEMNRYGETPAQALKFLNARADFDSGTRKFSMIFIDSAGKVKKLQNKFQGNPTKQVIRVMNDKQSKYLGVFNPSDLRTVDSTSGSYMFANKQSGKKLVLKPDTSSTAVDFASIQNQALTTIPYNLDGESKSSSDDDEGDYYDEGDY